jgi:hypothetical protein
VGKYREKDTTAPVLPATNPRLKPGDFPLGSLESRAHRAIAEDKDEGIILTLGGMPSPHPSKRNEQP